MAEALALFDGPIDFDLDRLDSGGFSLVGRATIASLRGFVSLVPGADDAGVAEPDGAVVEECATLLFEAAPEALTGRLRFSVLLPGERDRFFCAESFDDVPCDDAPTGFGGRIGVLELEASPDGPALPPRALVSRAQSGRKEESSHRDVCVPAGAPRAGNVGSSKDIGRRC